jgi:hypothetical protein
VKTTCANGPILRVADELEDVHIFIPMLWVAFTRQLQHSRRAGKPGKRARFCQTGRAFRREPQIAELAGCAAAIAVEPAVGEDAGANGGRHFNENEIANILAEP